MAHTAIGKMGVRREVLELEHGEGLAVGAVSGAMAPLVVVEKARRGLRDSPVPVRAINNAKGELPFLLAPSVRMEGRVPKHQWCHFRKEKLNEGQASMASRNSAAKRSRMHYSTYTLRATRDKILGPQLRRP